LWWMLSSRACHTIFAITRRVDATEPAHIA
jgi:hypothetical protein